MSVYIQNIESLVPEKSYLQSFIKEKMKGWLKGPKRVNRYIDHIYNTSDIAKRYSIISDMDTFFRLSADGSTSVPTTKTRNDLFIHAAKKMFVDLARATIIGCDNTSFRDITHVITVSCTGFFNPGPDYEIIKQLDLDKSVCRYNIGFMGCYAAFPALRLAHTICQCDPNATVLIVALELCTLHAQLKPDLDSIRSAAIFADGGAGVIVSAKAPGPNKKVFELKHFESMVIPDTQGHMGWTIGDNGFEMILSQYVPKVIESNIRAILMPMLGRQGMDLSDIDHWAIHPGGKAILDRIESSLSIDNRLEESRSVLRQYGNMSSATILFVLKQVLQKPSKSTEERVLSMAFGPGLTVEVGFLGKLTAVGMIEESTELAAVALPLCNCGEDST